MPENMPKPSMFPAPNRFQYAPSLFGTYQHLFIFHLCPTDFYHPPPHPHFKCFQQLFTCLIDVQVSAAYSATFQNVLFIIRFFCSQFSFPVNNFFFSMNNVLPIAVLAMNRHSSRLPTPLHLSPYNKSED